MDKSSLLLCLFFCFAISLLFGEGGKGLTVEIEEIKVNKGNIMMMLCDGEGKEIESFVIPVNRAGNLIKAIPELGPGIYTLKVYHDQNSDGKLNKNLLGIPTEPFAFSNNAWSSFGPPPLKEQRFTVKEGTSSNLRVMLRSYL